MKEKTLNPKQNTFCCEYLKDHNATQSAIRAKYSQKTASSIGERLLRKVEVQAKIVELEDCAAKAAGLTVDKIINELKNVAFSDIADFIEIDELTGAVRAKGFKQMPEGASRAIESIEEDRVISEKPDGSQTIVHDKRKFKRYNKVSALQTLLEHAKDPTGSKPINVNIVDIKSALKKIYE